MCNFRKISLYCKATFCCNNDKLQASWQGKLSMQTFAFFCRFGLMIMTFLAISCVVNYHRFSMWFSLYRKNSRQRKSAHIFTRQLFIRTKLFCQENHLNLKITKRVMPNNLITYDNVYLHIFE